MYRRPPPKPHNRWAPVEFRYRFLAAVLKTLDTFVPLGPRWLYRTLLCGLTLDGDRAQSRLFRVLYGGDWVCDAAHTNWYAHNRAAYAQPSDRKTPPTFYIHHKVFGFTGIKRNPTKPSGDEVGRFWRPLFPNGERHYDREPDPSRSNEVESW